MKYLLVLFFIAFAAAQNEWCTTPYCPQQNTHVACQFPDTSFGSYCAGRNPVWQEMTPILQEIITDRHNYFRNHVAGGNVTGYEGVQLPPARRMAKIRWDDQLAHFASLNVLQCEFGHDECRNSPTFRWSGQNIGMAGTSYTETDARFVLTEFLMNTIKRWFDEHIYARVSDIDKLSTIYNGANTFGHFTAVVNELQTHIGCGLVHYDSGSFRYHVFACNYAFTNMLTFPVYTSGATASGCSTGRDSLFPNLCTVNESINPNPFGKTENSLEN